MNAPPRPNPGSPDDGWANLTKLADRIEKYVRMYRWLTLVNLVVFGGNAIAMGAYLILRYVMAH